MLKNVGHNCYTLFLSPLKHQLPAKILMLWKLCLVSIFGAGIWANFKFQISVSYLAYFICINHAFTKHCESSSAVNSCSILLRGILISWLIRKTEGNTWNFVVTAFHFVIFYLSRIKLGVLECYRRCYTIKVQVCGCVCMWYINVEGFPTGKYIKFWLLCMSMWNWQLKM